MGLVWGRHTFTSFNYARDYVNFSRIPNGYSYLRFRFRWGFAADTPTTVDMQAISNNIISFGLVTVAGDGTEIPPNARTQAADQDPPTQRWVYWETRQPVVTALDNASGVIAWRDSGSTEETDSKGQVLATGLTGGQDLDLWATWASVGPWEPTGHAVIWVGISVLIKTP